jgi:hypothetical protein
MNSLNLSLSSVFGTCEELSNQGQLLTRRLQGLKVFR